MVIGGSFASSKADDYSDLDMQLVVSGPSSDMAQELRSIADTAGAVVAAFSAEHVGLPHMLIVLYEDLVHADFEPVAISALGQRNAGLRAHVLWERDRTVSTALPAEHREDPAASLAWFEARVWTWSWYVQTKILRGELYEALDGIGYMRVRVLFPLLAMHNGERPAGARRAEGRMGIWAERFAATVPRIDPDSMMDALRATLDLYVELADPLLASFAVSPADAARAAVRPPLDAGLTWTPPK